MNLQSWSMYRSEPSLADCELAIDQQLNQLKEQILKSVPYVKQLYQEIGSYSDKEVLNKICDMIQQLGLQFSDKINEEIHNLENVWEPRFFSNGMILSRLVMACCPSWMNWFKNPLIFANIWVTLMTKYEFVCIHDYVVHSNLLYIRSSLYQSQLFEWSDWSTQILCWFN